MLNLTVAVFALVDAAVWTLVGHDEFIDSMNPAAVFLFLY